MARRGGEEEEEEEGTHKLAAACACTRALDVLHHVPRSAERLCGALLGPFGDADLAVWVGEEAAEGCGLALCRGG